MESGSAHPPPKRHFDPPECNGATPKRRVSSFKSPPPLKITVGETLFRILCPANKTGGVIGKGGGIIKQFRDETGAKIRIEEPVPGCDERVILIIAPSPEHLKKHSGDEVARNEDSVEEVAGKEEGGEAEVEISPAQKALVRVFERILQVDGEREERIEREEDLERDNGEQKVSVVPDSVVCRLLAPGNQVGCVLGKGGKVVEKIRQESGAQIRVLSKEQLPLSAALGDELIQIIGSIASVKKALLSVSSCLQDNPKSDASNFSSGKPLASLGHGSGSHAQPGPFASRAPSYGPGAPPFEYLSRNHPPLSGQETVGHGLRKVQDDEVVFRLLCANDKVGSVIGRGGSIVRTLQSETGALIRIADAVPECDERVIVVSAWENSESQRSPAQDAVIRVQTRISESLVMEKGAMVSAKLLVPSNQVGCVLGKGGAIIAEMRRVTGTSIRIFVKDQVPKCASANDELVQVTGSLQGVQDALFHITSKIRDHLFPNKPQPRVGHGPPFMSSTSEIPPPPHDPYRMRPEMASSPRMYSSVGFSNNIERFPRPHHSMDHFENDSYLYRGERSGLGPSFDRPPSPRAWAPQPVGDSGTPRGVTDMGRPLGPRGSGLGSGSQSAVVTSTTVEVVVPQYLMGSIFGENGSNLNQIRQISGAKVNMHDPRPGALEGLVVISGTPDQTHAAQSLLHAFILSGQSTP
ncbi:KH domain-containing protein HEN4 isoform X2 [Amborella trichopoda]|uniref:K Homology domain-containing protein n=1 Tax=Amborella trichopoda TaxID=13333 RepID=W1PIK4_AMBTC|nr:KH domain-containing protein HEN4 isoform X2 [Amborella trichopoda]ERN07461.1 hypothetical protein AMTR_s00019p00253900 [Amborella trichopoda]|eukprot:XP_006845786.1 KH domain-containing protein HEN4 isoform X2 [Amborella trichopoda]